MKIIYRISDGGYKKEKPSYITKQNCLTNAVRHFAEDDNFYIIQDGSLTPDDYIDRIFNTHIKLYIKRYANIGNGAGTFNLALDEALTYDDSEIVYFLEDDYIHRFGAKEVLLDAFNLPVDYVTLYDHPDKYKNPEEGGNPLCEGLSELTRVYCGKHSHYKITNSTTMTFAARVGTLKEDEEILRKWTSGTHPYDFEMFKELTEKGRKLVSSIPAFSTHGETQWLSPLYDWVDAV